MSDDSNIIYVDFSSVISQEVLQDSYRSGSGAREAIMAIAAHRGPEAGDPGLRADCFLSELWELGFKVVPLDGSEG